VPYPLFVTAKVLLRCGLELLTQIKPVGND